MKFTPGMLGGTLSGSQGNTVASHNRYGAYFRERTKPVISTTIFAQDAKNRFAEASSAWNLLSNEQRLSWKNWAQQNPIVDRLGVKRILDGHAAFVQLTTRQAIVGYVPTGDPPATTTPVDPHVYTVTYDIGAGTFQIAYSPTPLAADMMLWVQAAVTNSPGKNYVKNLMKLVFTSAAAAASPAAMQAPIEERFGSLVVDQTVNYQIHILDRTSGLISTPQIFRGQVIST